MTSGRLKAVVLRNPVFGLFGESLRNGDERINESECHT
jgi:hypothetical protein